MKVSGKRCGEMGLYKLTAPELVMFYTLGSPQLVRPTYLASRPILIRAHQKDSSITDMKLESLAKSLHKLIIWLFGGLELQSCSML